MIPWLVADAKNVPWLRHCHSSTTLWHLLLFCYMYWKNWATTVILHLLPLYHDKIISFTNLNQIVTWFMNWVLQEHCILVTCVVLSLVPLIWLAPLWSVHVWALLFCPFTALSSNSLYYAYHWSYDCPDSFLLIEGQVNGLLSIQKYLSYMIHGSPEFGKFS